MENNSKAQQLKKIISKVLFSEQFFFFILLIGLIPCALAFSDIISPNLPTFGDSVSIGNIGSDSFREGIDTGIKTFKDGFQFTNNDRFILLLLFVVSLILSISWCIKSDNKRRIIYLVHGFILVGIAYCVLSQHSEINIPFIFAYVVLYPIFSLISTVHFIRHGHIRSRAFFFSLVVATLIFGMPSAFLFLFIGSLLRFLYLAFKQNYEIVQSLNFRQFALIFLKSVLFWLPLLLFVIPGNKMSKNIHESSINGIYEYVFEVEKEPGDKRGFHKNEFEADLDEYLNKKFAPLEGEALDSRFNNIERNVKSTVAGLSEGAQDQSNQLPKVISKIYYDEMNKALSSISVYFQEEKCGWHILFPTSCCVMNKAKSYLFHQITKMGNEMGKAIEKNIRNALRSGNKNAQGELKSNEQIILESLEKNKQIIEEKIQELKMSIRNTIMNIYNGIILFNLIMDLLLFILIIKSFLVVFARVAFSGKEDIYVTLLDPDKKMKKGEIKKCGNQYTIPSNSTEDFFTSRSFEPSGRPPKFSIPQFTNVLLGRLFTSNYAMNHIVMRNRKGAVYYHALGGTEFVEWTLEPNEEVIFHFKNFVAMSEGIKLSTTLSFRLTSLLLGRLRFTTAKGPGKLVLLTKGRPVTSEERKGNASVPVSRIIAWQKNTEFHVHSELNVVDVFLSGIYLQKKPSDLIIIDADEKGNAKSGISKFIKSFLLPI